MQFGALWRGPDGRCQSLGYFTGNAVLDHQDVVEWPVVGFVCGFLPCRDPALSFLIEHPLVCGLFYCAAIEEVMSLVVLPLSALHARGPYELHDLIQGLLVHMVVVGLPIAFSVRRFAR